MMKKNLIIIGARGWGREVLYFFRSSFSAEYNYKGFLDDNSHALDGLRGDYPPILSSVENYDVQPDDVFFCALGDPEYRRKYAEIIKDKGGEFVSYISPLATVSPNAIIGNGSFIGYNCFISDNVTIGEQAMVHGFTSFGHDVKIGDYVSIEGYCFFGGYSEVGDLTSIHVRSTILSHKRIGRNCSVGACSVVIKNVKDCTHVFGNPAKKIEY